MHDSITWIGMDVHKESIVVTAVGNDPERIRSRFELPNTDKGIDPLAASLIAEGYPLWSEPHRSSGRLCQSPHLPVDPEGIPPQGGLAKRSLTIFSQPG